MLVMLMCMVASLFVKATGLPFWTGGIFLFFLGIILYVINVRLITHFIDIKGNLLCFDILLKNHLIIQCSKDLVIYPQI